MSSEKFKLVCPLILGAKTTFLLNLLDILTKVWQNEPTTVEYRFTLLGKQYKTYPEWSYQLNTDNLAAEIKEHNDCTNEFPSYASVRRRMIERGWAKKASKKKNLTSGQEAAAQRLEDYEVRSYEAEHAHALWHLDFHECSRRVSDANGEWHTPKVLCVLDDHSRLCCHIQWYLNETSEVLIHGLSQAF